MLAAFVYLLTSEVNSTKLIDSIIIMFVPLQYIEIG